MSNNSHARFLNHLHLSEQQLHKLVEILDAKATPPTAARKRRDTRYPYLMSGLSIRVKHVGNTWGRYLVRPRNISSGGVAFFHGSYLHAGSYCLIALLTRDGAIQVIDGHVRHCRYVVGNIHEVGLRFDTPIDVTPFIAAAAAGQAPASTAEHAQYAGQVLVVDPSDEDRSLLKFQAQQLGLDVADVCDAPEAIDLARSGGYKLVFIGQDPATMTAVELAGILRQDGYDGALVAWGREPGEGETDVLGKPFCPDDLSALLRRRLGRDTAGSQPVAAAIASALWDQPPMRPKVIDYLEQLEEQVLKLQAYLERDDVAQLEPLLNQLGQAASSTGYPGLSAKANALLEALGAADAAQRNSLGLELIEQCQAACRFRDGLDYAQIDSTTTGPSEKPGSSARTD